jgi:hypothetical protein
LHRWSPGRHDGAASLTNSAAPVTLSRGAMESILRFKWTVVLVPPDDDWSPDR